MVKRVGMIVLILLLAFSVSADKSWWRNTSGGMHYTAAIFRVAQPSSGTEWHSLKLYLWSGASGNARIKVFMDGSEILTNGWMLEPGMSTTVDIPFDSVRVVKGAAADTLNYICNQK